jgi:NAD+ kinase
MHKNCAINIRPEDKESINFIKKIIEILSKKNVNILLPDYSILKEAGLSRYIARQDEFFSRPDLVISIGGDGTLLHTARLFPKNTAIFGINKGRLGFLTEFMPEEALNYLDNIINEEYEKSERDMLDVTQIRQGKEILKVSFLNDVAISRGIYSRPISINLEIDGKLLNSFSGDGLLVSTSTGSTAYSLSAGGPIITPTIKGVYMIMPVCPHTLAMRPLLIHSDSILKVTTGNEFLNTIMTIDGHESIKVDAKDEILFTGSEKKIVLIAHPEKNFFEILKEKFNWGR